jgi:hydrogenase maturation protease
MKILVAGIGNVHLGDDGFGPAVIAALRASGPGAPSPGAAVEVADYGVCGVDLAFALTGGIDAAILVDAVARGGAPGTLYLLEPAANAPPEIRTSALDPARVLAFAATLGTTPRLVRVIGCEPKLRGGPQGDAVIGLSEPVARAIEPAAQMVGELVARIAEGAYPSPS